MIGVILRMSGVFCIYLVNITYFALHECGNIKSGSVFCAINLVLNCVEKDMEK